MPQTLHDEYVGKDEAVAGMRRLIGRVFKVVVKDADIVRLIDDPHWPALSLYSHSLRHAIVAERGKEAATP